MAAALTIALIIVAPLKAQPALTVWTNVLHPAFPGDKITFNDETLRLVVRPALTDRTIQVRFSNRYGKTPLRIGHATVASALNEGDIEPTTARPLTFLGHDDLVIEPGAETLSDPVELKLPPLRRIAITLYLPQPTPADTQHSLAQQPTFVAKGDQYRAARLDDARQIEIRPFLAEIVAVPAGKPRLVSILGDSTVDGDGSTVGLDHRYPDYLADRLLILGNREWIVLNDGIIGNRLLSDSPGIGTPIGDGMGRSTVARLTTIVDRPGLRCVIIRTGINDIGFLGSLPGNGGPVDFSTMIAGYKRLIALGHRHGLTMVGTTLTPFQGAEILPGYYSRNKDRMRRAINRWMRQEHPFDALIDADAALRDPVHPARIRKDYDSGDHLHPNDAGYHAAAAVTDLSVCTKPRRS